MIGSTILKRYRAVRRSLGYALIMVPAVIIAASGFAVAQTPSFAFKTRSYVNPFPQTDRYHLHVLGDYVAGDLARGLKQAFEKDGTVKIINSTKSSAGLARPDRTNWPADIADLAKAQPVHIAVLMMGMNDVRNIRGNSGVVKWGTEEWRNAYADQIDGLIKALKAKNIAVYWVGVPVMAKAKTSEAMASINDILRERSYINGAKYIDSWSGFTDQFGAYAAYGPDLTGQNKRLREPDGVSFTARGGRKLANFVEVILRRDLDAARRERNISLAGDEDEQVRLVPKSDDADSLPQEAETGGDAVGDKEPGAQPASPPRNSQAEDAASPKPQLKSVRAKAPVSGAAGAQPAQSVFISGYAPPGETIIGDTSEGVTGLATVSPLTDLNANLSERRLPVTERLYYKALVKGEALKPKPGRADDFRWPRS